MPRPKGSPNRTTREVKEALQMAFEGIGGVDALERWAKENPTPFYQLWGKLLPLQVAGDKDNPLSVVHRVVLEAMTDTSVDDLC